ncbi:sensor histidine kinase YesM [Pedobacter sp. AK013]|uniref:sensor histidine kinase n=1 Tax=Pedobacter sp. AK013 TaxID=2723071 RepID=UPI001608CBDD|nr:sensor histidine kinase [Pedobacter sp. AK013]MBB6237279.1 sensor histidine kinase YesM [Pedobacter sp. AK013]
MKNWLKNYRWHIIAWAIFILYEHVIVSLILDINADILNYFIHYIINITLFYIHAELVLTRGLKPQKPAYLSIVIFTLLELCLHTVIAYLADRFFSKTMILSIGKHPVIDWKHMFLTVWRGIYFLLFSTAYYFIKSYIQQKHRTVELEKEAIEEMLKQKQTTLELANAKNAYLKAQINPHFMFNTLTYIYNSTHKSEPRAAEAVRYLSKLMRYALECEHGPEIMPLEAEIRQVENLLLLSRIKQPDLFIDFSYDRKTESTEVIPLLLLTLIENMVKHGNLSQPEDPGKIIVKLQKGLFSIQTSNLINTGLNDTGFHTGLENIRQRLLHTYADKAEISSGPKGNYFEVLITINLVEAR